MSLSYKEIWSPRAERDLDQIITYLKAEWSLKATESFLKKMERTISIIQKNPTSFSNVKGNIYKGPITKQITIYYRIKGMRFDIIALFDTRQNPRKLKV